MSSDCGTREKVAGSSPVGHSNKSSATAMDISLKRE
jgi:hypothetical protein